MQVFKICSKILLRYKGTILLYFGIFMGVALFMSQVTNGNSSDFEQEVLQVGLIDQDQKSFAKELKNYFGKQIEWQDMEDDEEVATDELYWRKKDYILIIPKGFEESLNTENPMDLSAMKVPGYSGSIYFESDLTMYLQKIEGLLASGETLTEAQNIMCDLGKDETKVELASFSNVNKNDKTTTFFLYVPYLFLSVCVSGIGLLLSVYNEQEVKRRTECSSLPLWKRNLGVLMTIFTFGLLFYLVVLMIGGILSKGTLLTDIRFGWFAINILAMLVLSLSLGFFAGTAARNRDAINGITNVIGLSFCFMGGIFVPMELFSKSVDKVARWFPTYWYVKLNNEVGALKEVTPEFVKDFWLETGIILCYGLLFFAITLIIIGRKRKTV